MTEPAAECRHGATDWSNDASLNKILGDFLSISDDLKIINENASKQVPSKKIQKKALARIEKRHKGYINAGKSSFVPNIYGICTDLILKGRNMEEARCYCREAIEFRSIVWKDHEACQNLSLKLAVQDLSLDPDTATATAKALVRSQDKVDTERGLILHVAKRIPCGCLATLSREAKKKPRTAYCQGCEEEKLFCDMLQCSGCKEKLYCSEECNKKNWKDHKSVCRLERKA